MFRKGFIVLVTLVALTASSGASWAFSLFVDSAPRQKYNSSAYNTAAYDSWWSDTKSGIFGGTFVNMANSANPANWGTTNFDIRDMVQYDLPDFGRQLNFIFWLPDESVATMTGIFERAMIIFDNMSGGILFDWDKPEFWEDDPSIGLIGTVGFALDASGIPAAELDEYITYLGSTQGDVIFGARRLDSNGGVIEEKYVAATYAPVPEPSTFLLLGAGLVGFGLLRRNKRS